MKVKSNRHQISVFINFLCLPPVSTIEYLATSDSRVTYKVLLATNIAIGGATITFQLLSAQVKQSQDHRLSNERV